MRSRKNTVFLICAAFFLLGIAALRGFNIYISKIHSDVMYEDAFVIAMDIIHDVLTLVFYGLSVATVAYGARVYGYKKSLLSATLMSIVILADRIFCIIYDLAVSNITVLEKQTLSTAVTWLAIDFAFFAIMYFAGATVSSSIEAGREKKGIESRGIFFGGIAVTAGIMTVLQLISQLIICVQFFMEYDDVTATEIAQMAGDILRIIVEYGGIVAGAAIGFYALISLFDKKIKNQVTN